MVIIVGFVKVVVLMFKVLNIKNYVNIINLKNNILLVVRYKCIV